MGCFHSMYHYFLTILDDNSRFVWTFLMKHKSDTRTILTRYFNTICTQFSKKIKVLTCDNGPEFNLHDLFSAFGTVVQHSCVETPQQNARVERKHQHLLNVARSLLFQSHLPVTFWGDCILAASYLINRTPSSILPDNLSPFQVHFKKSPYYHLRVFGCLCFASTLSRNRDKFSPQASKCVFLGYPSGYKGYRVLDIDSNQELITRNVVFHENIFPFAHLQPSIFPTPPQHITDYNSLSPRISENNPLLPSSITITENKSITENNPTSIPTTDPPENNHHTRAGRITKTPNHLTDYICNSVSSTTPYPISSYFSLSHLAPNYLKYIVLMTAVFEPKSYSQAAKHVDWQLAMQEELAALAKTNTWEILPLPPGKIPNDCKWVC